MVWSDTNPAAPGPPPGSGARATITDVAHRAGVSIATVSRTLRGAVNVSEQTRTRVLQAADDLAYVPSPAASRLASGHAGAIGVIVQFVARWFFAEVVRGAEIELREAGYDLLLYNVGDAMSREHFFTALPLRRRVDAVLAVATSFDDEERAALDRLDVPVVVVGGQIGHGHAGVGIDDHDSAAVAVRHLIELGHEDIVMISGCVDDPIGRGTTLARQGGFRAALAEAGLPDQPDRIVSEPWGVDGGRQAMERLLARPRLATAVFAESDEIALGALQAMRSVGVSVPDDVSLVGFDDHELAASSELTTIAQPVHEQGRIAARIALDRLAGSSATMGRTTDPEQHTWDSEGAAVVILPTQLIVRGTTGPPRTGDRRPPT